MDNYDNEAKALFISSDGNVYPDYLICSGKLIDSPPCPYSINGRIPDPIPLDPIDPDYSVDKGKKGELCPPCVKQHLSNLGHWDGERGNQYPEGLKPLRLFKCNQWLWLVIPGLLHESAKVIQELKG